MLVNAKRTLVALMVIGSLLTVGVTSASAMLSNVGPHLSSNPAKAKVQVETMLHHDKAIQAFYVKHSPSSSNLTMQDIASAKVTDLRFGRCRIGVSKMCPINTGKDSAGNVVKTSFRFGEVRPVAIVEIEIGKERFKFTLESPCVNLLSPLFPVFVPLPPRPPRPPHIPVSPKKPITYQLVSTSYSISTSTSSSSATCPAGTVESVAGSGANAGAVATATATVFLQKRHAWGSLIEKINSISTTTYTNTGTGTSVTCTPSKSPPPPGICETNPKECEETPPVEHWTAISCTGFEEISGDASFLVDCAVSDDNGSSISLEAHSNDSNSRVSGINCFSNGGSQTCPSGGIFEFRVSGINDGSSILYSSITAVASANGVKATFTSDPFPVDPSGGGF